MPIHVPPQYPLHTPTKIAFVGEAPSDTELERGIPLTGPSGRVFNSMLRTAGLDRAEFMVTNVFDEQLPDNDVSAWCAPLSDARGGGYSDLPPVGAKGFLRPEHRWHLERLRDELEIARPNVIVPLGGTALWAFTGDTSISAYRGTVSGAKFITPGAKLLPTFHPAAVIHQWKLYSVVVGDFIKAQVQGEVGPKIIHPNRKLFVEPTLAEFREWMPRLKSSDLLSVDIETGWGQITCIGFAPNAEEAICLPFMDKRVPNRNYWKTSAEEVEAWELTREVLEDTVPKLGQNFGGYDAFWLLKKKHIAPRNFLHDTRLLHHALYPELPKTLEFMGASYGTQGSWKNWNRQTKEKRDD